MGALSSHRCCRMDSRCEPCTPQQIQHHRSCACWGFCLRMILTIEGGGLFFKSVEGLLVTRRLFAVRG